MLCYNKPLKDWLLQAIPQSFEDSLVVDNYHGLVDDLCRIANVPFWQTGDRQTAEFWDSHAPECLMQACDKLGTEYKFDAVIVDEGQDFQDLWWTSLDSVFRDPDNKACYYVFYDPNQNLFVERPSLPGGLSGPFVLPTNCRNTVHIANHCATLVGLENKVRDGAPVGDEPEIVEVANLKNAFKEAGKRVRALCMPNAGGLKTAQVAVLAPGNTERQWPNNFQTIPVTKSFEQWRDDDGVLIASWSRFKGLEADAVIIIDVPGSDESRDVANRYVARSRAKHLLFIIGVGEQ